MDLREVMLRRKSVRRYTDEKIPQESLDALLEAALLAPTSRNLNETDFILVQNPETLEQLSKVKASSAGMLAHAGAAIVVCGDAEKGDTWIEDSTIAMTYLHLKATELGLGSCWVQIRLRKDGEGRDAGENVRQLLQIPEAYQVEGIMAFGQMEGELALRQAPDLASNRIHQEQY